MALIAHILGVSPLTSALVAGLGLALLSGVSDREMPSPEYVIPGFFVTCVGEASEPSREPPERACLLGDRRSPTGPTPSRDAGSAARSSGSSRPIQRPSPAA